MKTYHLISTLYEMLVQPHDTMINCRWYLATMQSMFHVQPIWMWRVVLHGYELILCHAIKLEHRYISSANHFYSHFHISWQVMDRRIPVMHIKKNKWEKSEHTKEMKINKNDNDWYWIWERKKISPECMQSTICFIFSLTRLLLFMLSWWINQHTCAHTHIN